MYHKLFCYSLWNSNFRTIIFKLEYNAIETISSLLLYANVVSGVASFITADEQLQ